MPIAAVMVTRHRSRMPRMFLAAAAAALMLAAPASAEYYLSKGLAQKYTSHYARSHHPLHKVKASCRPKGHRTTPKHGKRAFHRWMCTYRGYDENSALCSGYIQIKGGSDHDVYWWLVYQGLRCRK
jgi:hypothetical protein